MSLLHAMPILVFLAFGNSASRGLYCRQCRAYCLFFAPCQIWWRSRIHASLRAGLISFYLVPSAALSIQSCILLLSDARNATFHRVFNANSCRNFSTSCRRLSLYLLLSFILAGGIEINSVLLLVYQWCKPKTSCFLVENI